MACAPRRVRAVAKQRDLDLDGLAAAIGVAHSTLQGTLERRCRPSQRLWPLFEAFVVPRDGEPPAPAVRSEAAPAPEQSPATLAKAVRAKRRLTPMTTHTLARQIGIGAEELDAALAAKPVPPPVAERLQAWASA